jgi:hypothetical protein
MEVTRTSPTRVVVIDANAIVQGPWWLDSAAWRVLLYQARRGAIRLVVPEVVIREAVGCFQRALEDRLDKCRSAARNLRDLTRTELAAVDMEIAGSTGAYETHLRATLSDAHALLTPLPEIDISSLVDRAVGRRRPFDDSGSGFRDSLLWEAVVLEVLDDAEAEVALVSNDHHAFWESAQSSILHPHLVEDLRTRQTKGAVRLEQNLVAYLDSVGYSNPDLLARIVEDIDARQDRLIGLVENFLTELEVTSSVFPGVKGIVIRASDTSVKLERMTAPSSEEAIVLVHLAAQSTLTLGLSEAADVREVSSTFELTATATYDGANREFGNLAVDPPTLDGVIHQILRSSVVAAVLRQSTALNLGEMFKQSGPVFNMGELLRQSTALNIGEVLRQSAAFNLGEVLRQSAAFNLGEIFKQSMGSVPEVIHPTEPSESAQEPTATVETSDGVAPEDNEEQTDDVEGDGS